MLLYPCAGLSGPLGTLSGCGSNEEQQLACEKTVCTCTVVSATHGTDAMCLGNVLLSNRVSTQACSGNIH